MIDADMLILDDNMQRVLANKQHKNSDGMKTRLVVLRNTRFLFGCCED